MKAWKTELHIQEAIRKDIELYLIGKTTLKKIAKDYNLPQHRVTVIADHVVSSMLLKSRINLLINSF